MRLLLLALLLSGCAEYTTTRYQPAHLRVYLHGHVESGCRCAGREGEVDAVFMAVDDALQGDATPHRWGSGPITVCLVESRPYVVCGGYALAGCSYIDRVFVSSVYDVSDGGVPQGYDWRRTMVHEFIGLLAMRGGLRGVERGQGAEWEAALVASEPYRRVSTRVALW